MPVFADFALLMLLSSCCRADVLSRLETVNNESCSSQEHHVPFSVSAVYTP